MLNVNYLLLLFIIPFVLIPAYSWAFYRRRKKLQNFAQAHLLPELCDNISVFSRVVKAFLLILAFMLLSIALTRPRWNPQINAVSKQGRDVVILLDVSRSMLAEDIKPNRLERAKLAISDLLKTLDGDRAALLAFSGDVTVKSPLTTNYSFIRMIMPDITTQSASLGGTNIGDAIRKASNDIFDDTPKEFKDILLITDGEDTYDSLPAEAAAYAAQLGIRIIVIGIGSDLDGSPIPSNAENDGGDFIRYQGKTVLSKLNEQSLRQIALSTKGGVYVPVKTAAFDLGQIYQAIGSSAARSIEDEAIVYEEKFQIFLLPAFFILLFQILISEKRKG